MTLIVCPLAEVEALAAERIPSHVLSLLGPTLSPPPLAAVSSDRRLHLLFNDIIEPAEDVTEDAWDEVVNINLKGYFNCSQLAARQMIAVAPLTTQSYMLPLVQALPTVAVVLP